MRLNICFLTLYSSIFTLLYTSLQASLFFTSASAHSIQENSTWRLVFYNSILLEVASDSFCFLLHSSWLLVLILYIFFLIISLLNIFCWKSLYFSQNNFLILIFTSITLLFTFHYWFRDLLRELVKKYEVLLIYLFLLFLLFLLSETLLFSYSHWFLKN